MYILAVGVDPEAFMDMETKIQVEVILKELKGTVIVFENAWCLINKVSALQLEHEEVSFEFQICITGLFDAFLISNNARFCKKE